MEFETDPFELTDKDKAELAAIPPASLKEMLAIWRETTEQTRDMVGKIVDQAIRDLTPLRLRRDRGLKDSKN